MKFVKFASECVLQLLVIRKAILEHALLLVVNVEDATVPVEEHT
jgi:hypothetical protein